MPRKTKSVPKQNGILNEEDFSLEQVQAKNEPKPPGSSKTVAKKGKRAKKSNEPGVLSYRHKDKRLNNPDVGLVTPDTDRIAEPKEWKYDPHIDPALQFDVTRHQIETLIDDALESKDENIMRSALEQLKRQAAPYLKWTGKAERTSFEVDTVSLHVHERIDPATILAAVRKRMKGPKDQQDMRHQSDWLRAWFEEPLPLREAIDFYKHERGWANRLIAGDSLLVMNSLLQKESMAGQVQMIYIDPPYGIKYGSNFQPFVNNRNVTDRKDEDLTHEPEMIKAFRDTWELGIHSYLTYLRDRLLLAKRLLHESGSVFVQISNENLHHVQEILDEIFQPKNFVGVIWFRKKTMPLGATFLERMGDYIIWYAQDATNAKFNRLFKKIDISGDFHWNWRETDGRRFKLSKQEAAISPGGKPLRLVSMWPPSYSESDNYTFDWHGKAWTPPPGQCYPTNEVNLRRLARASRLEAEGTNLRYVLKLQDDDTIKINLNWADTVGARDQRYVVETSPLPVERCVLMTTDPGDLILDPTCGSGTTAYVAEKWGRRWITCDTSRVAVTVAKQRLMTASYDYYDLKYPHEGLRSGLIYKAVSRITLKSIANNPEIDTIYETMHPAIENAFGELNTTLRNNHAPPFEINEGGRKGESLDLTTSELMEWELPFDFPEGWPASARDAFDAFHAARQAMQKKMDASIAAHADQEILYDQPQVSKDKLRISGPFTVEAVPFPSVLALDETQYPKEADATIARSGESGRQHSWRDELLKTGVRGKGGQILRFAALETLPDLHYIHASGTLAENGERVVVSFGPEYAALEQRQVEMAMREAGQLFPRPKMIVFCAFTFDPEAAKDIDQTKGITALKVQMNTDLLTEDLKKARASNQSFWLMGQPDVEVRKTKDGKYLVEVHGFDYFDTVKGDLIAGGKSKIAVWALDTDYDERSLFPRQVFFPMAGKKEGWEKLKKNIRAELDESLLDKLHGTVSLPFETGENHKIAVKIVDDRGIESLKIINLD